MFDLKKLLPYIKNKKFFGDFSNEPLIKLLEEVEGNNMLICPQCGNNSFSGELISVTKLASVRPSDNRIVGVCKSMVNTVKLICDSCGATPEITDLEQSHTCYICGNPTKIIYYFHKQKGYYACPSCLEYPTKGWERVSI